MGKLYRSREGDITAIDTKTQLTTLGSQTAPGPLLVPAGATRLGAIIATFATDCAAAADGAIIVRLEGPGLPGGPETIAIGAGGVAVATGGHGSRTAIRIPLDVDVTAANEILIFAENVGEDLGTTTVGITCEFSA